MGCLKWFCYELTNMNDIILAEVLQRLQAASRENHLPAFQR